MATSTTIAPIQQRVSELFDIDSVVLIGSILKELEGYGIETEEQLDDAYSGCYPSNEAFCEDLLSDCYSEVINELPSWLQSAIDWELVWYQSMRYDYFAIYHEGDYYFFNRNFWLINKPFQVEGLFNALSHSLSQGRKFDSWIFNCFYNCL